MGNFGVSVGGTMFTDLDDDDCSMLPKDWSFIANAIAEFDTQASHLGLHFFWTKTNEENLECGDLTSTINVEANVVEPVQNFIYLGCKLIAHLQDTLS